MDSLPSDMVAEQESRLRFSDICSAIMPRAHFYDLLIYSQREPGDDRAKENDNHSSNTPHQGCSNDPWFLRSLAQEASR